MAGLVVLQARVSSTRLPGKVLLPVAGLPLVVLAARRAGSTGRRVVVATSQEPTDDVLCDALRAHDVAVHRGDLADVLGRFVGAVDGLDDGARVVRLTADNAFPDGTLLDAMEAELDRRGLGYLSCNGPDSHVPHGVGAEITTAGALRRARAHARDAYDLEHVTPAVIREHGRHVYVAEAPVSWGVLRATVDQPADYDRVGRVFEGIEKPVDAPWWHLVERLAALPDAPVVERPATDLVLGTAQLGGDYGVANRTGRPDETTTRAIVRTAISNGVAALDTARAYGASEDALGDALGEGWGSRVAVVTKTDPLADLADDAPPALVSARVEASVLRSCRALRRPRLDTVLLHRAAHLRSWDGAAWDRLLTLRDEGVVGRVGVSVQGPSELATALDVGVQHVQLPFNLLDHRWDALRERLADARAADGLVVHARSALLQGVLASDDPAVWARAGLDRHAHGAWLDQVARDAGRSVAGLCLAYVRAQPFVDGVVVGVETGAQLDANLRAFDEPPLDPATVAAVEAARPRVPDDALDPATWSRP